MTGRKASTTRAILLKRDGDLCYWCACRFTEANPATQEHLVPRSAGGTDALTNLRLACERCNAERGYAQDPHINGVTGSKLHEPGECRHCDVRYYKETPEAWAAREQNAQVVK